MKGKSSILPSRRLIWRMTLARLERRISGSVKAGRSAKSSCEYRRKHTPGPTRPQRPGAAEPRPARCARPAAARTVLRAVAPDARQARIHHEWMPGTVSEVSATLVASTMRRAPRGWNTRSCSSMTAASTAAGFRRPASFAGQNLRRLANLALAGEEHQHVALPRRGSFSTASPRAPVHPRRASFLLVADRAIAHLHRIQPAGDLDHRRIVEVPARISARRWSRR